MAALFNTPHSTNNNVKVFTYQTYYNFGAFGRAAKYYCKHQYGIHLHLLFPGLETTVIVASLLAIVIVVVVVLIIVVVLVLIRSENNNYYNTCSLWHGIIYYT